MPVIRTSDVGVDQVGRVSLYVPPNVTQIPFGSNVTYGTAVNLADGDSLPPGTGVWLVTSGQLVAEGAVTAIPVTITPI